MKAKDTVPHIIWACMCLFCGFVGFALTPLWTHVSENYLPPEHRPVRIQWCAGPDGRVRLCFFGKGEKVVLNLALDAKTGQPLSVTVRGAEDGSDLCTSLHPNGVPSEVSVRRAYVLKHSCGFYETGDVQFTSDIPSAGRRFAKEIRQYYDRSGKPTEKRRCIHLCGS